MSRKRNRMSGHEALEHAYREVDHAPLLQRLGVSLEDSHLRLALTHRSFSNENGYLPNNERLEFLGDAVLGLAVASRLYERYPHRPESDISKMRAAIVSRYGCADVAREINLGEHILLGRGEKSTDGQNKDSILADTTEAVLGAVYREHGFQVAYDVIMRLFGAKIESASAEPMHQDWKTALQERAAILKRGAPVYQSTSTGPAHAQVFTATVSVEGVEVGAGTGPNKKQAEQTAARVGYRALEEDIAQAHLREERAAAEKDEAAALPEETRQKRDAAAAAASATETAAEALAATVVPEEEESGGDHASREASESSAAGEETQRPDSGKG